MAPHFLHVLMARSSHCFLRTMVPWSKVGETIFGNRSKTHSRLSVSEWHLPWKAEKARSERFRERFCDRDFFVLAVLGIPFMIPYYTHHYCISSPFSLSIPVIPMYIYYAWFTIYMYLHISTHIHLYHFLSMGIPIIFIIHRWNPIISPDIYQWSISIWNTHIWWCLCMIGMIGI